VLLIITINCGTKDDIKIYTVVPPPVAVQPFDAEKYLLIDTLKSFEKLRTQAYTSKDTRERMQIFDYLFVHGPKHFGHNAVAEFFKHFDGSERKDWQGTREMDLIAAALEQDQYLAIKENCLYYMIQHYFAIAQIDSVIFYMDNLRTLFPESRLFNERHYVLVKKISDEIKRVNMDKTIKEPERLWKLGYAYWKLGTSGWKSPLWAFQKPAKEYFAAIENNYPDSPFNANATYAVVEYEYTRAREGEEDSACGIFLKNKFEDLLTQYPKTTARDEILLNSAGYYFCKISNSRDLNTTCKYLHIADSVYSLINPDELFDENSRHLYNRMESNIIKYLRKYKKLTVDFNGKLYKSIFYGWEQRKIDTSGLSPILERKICKFMKRYSNFQSRIPKPQDLSFPHDVIYNKRMNIERAIVSLIDTEDIRDLAAEYAANAVVYYEWEGMSDGPFEEGRYAEEYLNKDYTTPLKPYLVLFIAHRYRCAYECIIANNETKWKNYTELRYGYYLHAAKSCSNLLINLIAEDMDRERFFYIPDGERP